MGQTETYQISEVLNSLHNDFSICFAREKPCQKNQSATKFFFILKSQDPLEDLHITLKYKQQTI